MDLPLHPKIVHLPIALSLLMPFLSLGTLLAWIRGWLPRRAFVIALLLQAVLVGSAIAGLRSGEGDEERVEEIVGEAPIEEHEEASKLFTWVAGGVLGIMLAAAFVRDERVARSVAALSVVGTVVVFGLGYRAGAAGGHLVYEHGAADAYRGSAGADGTGPEGARGHVHEHDEE